MVHERIQAALAHPANQKPSRQQALIDALNQFAQLGIIDPTTSEVVKPAEINLTAEWQRQTQIFIDHRFHLELGYEDTLVGKLAFLDSLPQFKPQPEGYRGRFDIPLLVIGGIPWERQAELAGIDISSYLRSRSDEVKPYKPGTPDKSFTGWFNRWGQRFPDPIKPFDARNQLQSDEAGGNLRGGVSMQLMHPEYNKQGNYFDLIEDSVGSVRVPDLLRWRDRPRFHARFGAYAGARFRPLVRGSQIVTL